MFIYKDNMSKEIRQMTDKIKNFNHFLNENVERTSYKGYNIGNVIDGGKLDNLSGNLLIKIKLFFIYLYTIYY